MCLFFLSMHFMNVGVTINFIKMYAYVLIILFRLLPYNYDDIIFSLMLTVTSMQWFCIVISVYYQPIYN